MNSTAIKFSFHTYLIFNFLCSKNTRIDEEPTELNLKKESNKLMFEFRLIYVSTVLIVFKIVFQIELSSSKDNLNKIEI